MGPLGRPLYFVRRALDAMVRGPRVALTATMTIFVAVLVTGGFAAALRAGAGLLDRWAGEVRISVYLLPRADLERARAAAAALAPGRRVEAVGEEEALRRFRQALGSDVVLAEGLTPGVLPASVEVSAPGIRLAEARALAKSLEAVPGAAEVDFGSAWVERLERILSKLRWAGAALLLALGAGTSVLVANTLRLGVLARRDEIEIMKLVGATDLFVEAPFLIEGLVQGLLGGALAAGALWTASSVALSRLAALGLTTPLGRPDLVPSSLLAMLLAGGAALGLVSSALAVRRELALTGPP